MDARPPDAPRARDKCLGAAEAAGRIAAWLGAGERVTLVRGVFDLLQIHHLRVLAGAKAGGGRVVAGVLDDRAGALALGPGRPVLPAAERALLVAGLRCVDAVLELGEGAAVAALAGLAAGVVDADPTAGEERGADVADRLRARLGLRP